jgi:hypothetical protein
MAKSRDLEIQRYYERIFERKMFLMLGEGRC